MPLFCFTSSLVINTLQMVFNCFVDNTSAEQSPVSSFVAVLNLLCWGQLKKQALKQADRNYSEKYLGNKYVEYRWHFKVTVLFFLIRSCTFSCYRSRTQILSSKFLLICVSLKLIQPCSQKNDQQFPNVFVAVCFPVYFP